MRTNLHHLVAGCADATPDAAAVTYKKQTITYAELWAEIQRVAAGLLSLGIARESRVAVYLEKRIETVAAIFATSAAGAVFVPVNPLLRAPQVGHILRDCDVSVLITSPDRLALLEDDIAAQSGTSARRARGCQRRRSRQCGWVHDARLGTDGSRASARHPNRTASTSTSPRSSTRPAAPASRRASSSATATSSSAPKRVQLSGQPARRRHPRRVAAELRRRFQPADHRVRGRRSRRSDELPAARRRAAAVRATRRHRAHLRPAAVDSDRRAEVAGGGARIAALLRQHRRAHAQADPRQAARGVPRRASRS